jgi:hypothetical protein
VSRARSAVPAYLSRLAGRTPAHTPRLQPPRSLFAPVAGALTGAEPDAPAAAFGGHAGPVHFGPGAGQPGPAPRSFVADIPASRGPSEAQAQDGANLDPLPAPPPAREAGRPGPAPRSLVADIPASRGPSEAQAQDGANLDPLPAPPPARRAMPAVPPAEGSRFGPARRATNQAAQEADTPGRGTPDTTVARTAVPNTGPDHSRGAQPLAAPPLGPAAAAAPGLTPQAPEAASAETRLAAARTVQPAGAAQPGMGPNPAPIPAGSPEPAAVPTKSPLPAAAPALPRKRALRAMEISDYPGLRRPRPMSGSATSAQVSIGTVEVTIVPPVPTPSPIPPPPHQRARPGQVGTPRRAGVDAARQAARGAARRWFGAGQS